MKVCCITATKNRHKCLERIVRFLLNQTSNDWVHLIFNNSNIPLRLNSNLPTDKFILVNSPLSSLTHKAYKSLGEIYNDALKFVPKDTDIINFMDDDDVFFPNHIEEGIKGLERGGKTAYKPQKSYYKYGKKSGLVENIFEPSIFVKTEHIKKYGFSDETTAQHHQWLQPLIQTGDCYVDKDGPPTFIYDWSQEIPSFKTSGNATNPDNFLNYEKSSVDIGDGIITPCSVKLAEHYYKI